LRPVVSEINSETNPPNPLSGSQKLCSIFIEKNNEPNIIDRIRNSNFKKKLSIFFFIIKYTPQIIKLIYFNKSKTQKDCKKK